MRRVQNGAVSDPDNYRDRHDRKLIVAIQWISTFAKASAGKQSQNLFVQTKNSSQLPSVLESYLNLIKTVKL